MNSFFHTVHPLYTRFFYSRICLFVVFFSKSFFPRISWKTADKYLSTYFSEKSQISVQISLIRGFLGENREYESDLEEVAWIFNAYSRFFRKTAKKYLFAVFMLIPVHKYFSADFFIHGRFQNEMTVYKEDGLYF